MNRREMVILIPGIMGSVLKKNGEEIWPGKEYEFLIGYRRLEELLEPDLEVGGVIESYYLAQYVSIRTCPQITS